MRKSYLLIHAEREQNSPHYYNLRVEERLGIIGILKRRKPRQLEVYGSVRAWMNQTDKEFCSKRMRKLLEELVRKHEQLRKGDPPAYLR